MRLNDIDIGYNCCGSVCRGVKLFSDAGTSSAAEGSGMYFFQFGVLVLATVPLTLWIHGVPLLRFYDL